MMKFVTGKDYFYLLIIIIICTIPLPLFVCNMFYLLLIIYTIYYAFVNKIKPRSDYVNIASILFYMLMALSYTWSINKNLTLIGIGRKSAFLIIPLLFLFVPKFNLEDTNRVFRYFSFAIGSYAIFFISMGFFHYIKTGSLANLTQHELVSPLDLSRIYVSLFSAIAFFHMFFNEKKNLKNNLLIGLLGFFLVLLSSKSILITMLVIILFFSFWKKKSVSGLKRIMVFMLIFITMLGMFKFNPKFFTELSPRYKEIITKQDFQRSYYFNGSELRILYTRFLYEFEKEEQILFTGFGLNATQEKLNEKCLKYNVPTGYGTKYNFHNQYNQTLAEIGIIGLLLLLYLLFLGLKYSITNQYTFAIAVFLIFSMLFLTESVFNRQRGVYFFLITYFLIINTKFSKDIST